MKKIAKAVLTGVAALAVCGAIGIAACGGGNTTYTLHTRAIITEDYMDFTGDCPFIINYGNGTAEEEGGMFDLENWASQKFLVSDDGELFEYGLSYDFTLVAEDTDDDGTIDYTFSLACNVAGNGTLYTGEGVLTYNWYGTATEVDGGYKLSAPTKADAAVTGTIAAVNTGTNMCSFPSTGYTAYNNGGTDYGYSIPDDYSWTEEYASFGVNPANLLTMFTGCTVLVSGSAITGFSK